MGSSPSKSHPPIDISGPRSLAPAAAAAAEAEMVEARHRDTPTRRATAGASTSSRSPPPSTHSHRRAKSAAVVADTGRRRNRDSAPPPYSALAANSHSLDNIQKITAPSPPPSINLTSSHGSNPSRYLGYPPLNTIPEAGTRLSVDTRKLESSEGNNENVLEALREYNTVIIVDDSASMAGNSWAEARDALAALADIASRYDTDGIDVCFLNDVRVGRNMMDAESVKELFRTVQPSKMTPLAKKLDILTLFYMEQLDRAKAAAEAGDHRALRAVKPINYIVITDGASTDEPTDVIVALARRLDAGHYPLSQLGIQFVQIGNDPKATQFLNELDDDLSRLHGVRDIVDTTPYSGQNLNAELIVKILLGGINRRVDRKGARSVMNL